MRIYVDDIRRPPDGWLWCRSWEELRYWLARHDGAPIEVLSLDHDLGENEPDGYEIIRSISSQFPLSYPQRLEVHSANPVGAENIRKFDEWFRRVRADFNDAIDRDIGATHDS